MPAGPKPGVSCLMAAAACFRGKALKPPRCSTLSVLLAYRSRPSTITLNPKMHWRGRLRQSFFRQDRERKLQVFEEVKDPAVAIAINVQQTLSIATDDPVIAWTFIKSDHLRALVISSDKDPLAAMINAGVKQKRFDVRSARTVAITIRGAALAVVQDVLNGTADKNAVREFQCLVLRMLGISPQECTVVVKQAAALFRAVSI